MKSISEDALQEILNAKAISVDDGNECYKSVDGVLFDKNMTTLVKYPPKKACTEYTIPHTVSSISKYAFTVLDSSEGLLKEIKINDNNEHYTTVDGVLFNKDMTALIKYPPDKSSEAYSIPTGVEVVCDYAFYYSNNLKTIDVPDTVKELGSHAFDRCHYMTGMLLPDSIEKIGVRAFRNCDSMRNIIIPDSVTEIEDYTFSYCRNLNHIVLPDGITRIGKQAFAVCDSLSHIKLSSSLDKIDFAAFLSCEKLEYISLPKSIKYIDRLVFENCTSLKNIYYAGTEDEWENVTVGKTNKFDYKEKLIYSQSGDDSYVFKNGDFNYKFINNREVAAVGYEGNEKEIIIPDKAQLYYVTKVEFDMGSFESIGFPSGITDIDFESLKSCNYLKSITVAESNPNYSSDSGVLFDKNKTEILLYPIKKADASYKIPDTVKAVTKETFSGNIALKSVSIPDSVASIHSKAFYNCSSLSDVAISKKVKNIATDSFDETLWLKNYKGNFLVEGDGILFKYKGTDMVTRLALPSNARVISDGAFAGVNMKKLVCNSNLTSIGANAFSGCKSLNGVVLSKKLQSIGDYAFYNCTNLKKALLPKSVNKIGTRAFGYYKDNKNDYPVENFILYVYNKSDAAALMKNSNADDNIMWETLDVKITLKSTPQKLYIGEKYTVLPKITDKQGNSLSEQMGSSIMESIGSVSYKSSDSKVAKINSNGKITALNAGKTTITVKYADRIKQFRLKVAKPKITPAKKTIKKGKSFTLSIKGKVGKVTYSSSRKKVATVNKKGKITALKKGKTVITVKVNGFKLKCKITVV